MRLHNEVHVGTVEVNINIKETKSLPKLHKRNIKNKMEHKYILLCLLLNIK